MNATIYFNDACSTCHKTLAILNAQNITPKKVHYLDTPPAFETLLDLAERVDDPETMIRKKHELWNDELDVDVKDSNSVARWLSQNLPALQRPIVALEDGRAIVARPPERVLELF